MLAIVRVSRKYFLGFIDRLKRSEKKPRKVPYKVPTVTKRRRNGGMPTDYGNPLSSTIGRLPERFGSLFLYRFPSASGQSADRMRKPRKREP